jgi:sialate O-acetylesterase
MKKTILLLALGLWAGAAGLRAELKLPAIIGDHMVLQQQQANPIWGWETPGTAVSVTFAGQTLSTKAAVRMVAGRSSWRRHRPTLSRKP